MRLRTPRHPSSPRMPLPVITSTTLARGPALARRNRTRRRAPRLRHAVQIRACRRSHDCRAHALLGPTVRAPGRAAAPRASAERRARSQARALRGVSAGTERLPFGTNPVRGQRLRSGAIERVTPFHRTRSSSPAAPAHVCGSCLGPDRVQTLISAWAWSRISTRACSSSPVFVFCGFLAFSPRAFSVDFWRAVWPNRLGRAWPSRRPVPASCSCLRRPF